MGKPMIRFILIPTIHCLIWMKVSAASNEVIQTPSDLLRKPGEFAVLQCLHSISSYNVILCGLQGTVVSLKAPVYSGFRRENLLK
ncbi:hypothetical protein AOLI_G00119950 [Acnodon oligacanthus]